jgi:hypothetical protein
MKKNKAKAKKKKESKALFTELAAAKIAARVEAAYDKAFRSQPILIKPDGTMSTIQRTGKLNLKYRGYVISETAAHAREWRYEFAHADYDGDEDLRCGRGKTVHECKEQIDEMIFEAKKKKAKKYECLSCKDTGRQSGEYCFCQRGGSEQAGAAEYYGESQKER